MGADLHDQLIKSKRDQSRTCALCQQRFRVPADLKAHLAVAHQHTPDQAEKVRLRPSPPPASRNPPIDGNSSSSPDTQGPAGGTTGSSPPNDAENGTRDITARLAHNNASSLVPEIPSRSHTPLVAGADGASMRISKLSLDESVPVLVARHADSAAAINRKDNVSPSKKRPASSDVNSPRPQVAQPARLRVDYRQPGLKHQLRDDFQRPRPSGGKLFDPNADPTVKQPQKHPQKSHQLDAETFQQQIASRNAQNDQQLYLRGLLHHQRSVSPEPQINLQASSRQLTHDQLQAEVAGLYRSLEIVERRCIALDQAHLSEKGKRTPPEPKHWQALTALHRTLLYEHHDFLLASQHPTAPAELRALASQRQIPFRMWKHAISTYLELLRQHVPESLEFMESFIYLAYQMISLLYETVPAFEDVWLECLGDLARYRMAIEYQWASVRDVWIDVARYWYTKASDRQPRVGRLYHHLGILARPHLVQQLSFYCRALCCVQPFPNAKASLKAVFDACNQPQSQDTTDPSPTVDILLTRAHKLLYEASDLAQAEASITDFISQLKETIPPHEKKWKEYGAFLAVANISACFGYGASDHPLKLMLEKKKSPRVGPELPDHLVGPWFLAPVRLLSETLSVVLSRKDDSSMLPHTHVVLVAVRELCLLKAPCREATSLLDSIPWGPLAECLNYICSGENILTDRIRQTSLSDDRLDMNDKDNKPLLEDYAMRGATWCKGYNPAGRFGWESNDELPHHEPASAERRRIQRIRWLAMEISLHSNHLTFDKVSGNFAHGAMVPMWQNSCPSPDVL